ncbi:hypothetical protein, partial [Streptomyces sp. NRRL S-15]
MFPHCAPPDVEFHGSDPAVRNNLRLVPQRSHEDANAVALWARSLIRKNRSITLTADNDKKKVGVK